MKKTLFSLVAVLSLAGAALADQTPDHKVLVLKNKDGAAILGYDAVAYFTDDKPAKGNPKFQSEYEGAKYYFASAEHKALFNANPAKYAPAYGGYCGYAASIDRLSPISPEWFQIIDGRLILQHNKKATDKFNADQKGNIVKADQNWPGLVVRNSFPRPNIWRTTDQLARHLQARGIAPARGGCAFVRHVATASSCVREFQFASFHNATQSLATLGILVRLDVLSARRNLLGVARAEISRADRADRSEPRHFLRRHGG